VAPDGSASRVSDASSSLPSSPSRSGRPCACGGNIGLTSPAAYTVDSPGPVATRMRWRSTSTSTTRPSPVGVITRLPSLGRPLRISA